MDLKEKKEENDDLNNELVQLQKIYESKYEMVSTISNSSFKDYY